jgi:hypothetical protein
MAGSLLLTDKERSAIHLENQMECCKIDQFPEIWDIGSNTCCALLGNLRNTYYVQITVECFIWGR